METTYITHTQIHTGTHNLENLLYAIDISTTSDSHTQTLQTYNHTHTHTHLQKCSSVHAVIQSLHTHTLPTFMYTLRRTTTHLQKCNSRHTVLQFCTHTHSCTPSDTQPHTLSWLCTTTLHRLNPTEAVTVTQFLHTHRNTHTHSLGHKTQTSDF